MKLLPRTTSRSLNNGYVCLQILRIINRMDKVQPDAHGQSFHLTREERHALKRSIEYTGGCIRDLRRGDKLSSSEARESKERCHRTARKFSALATSLNHPNKHTRKRLEAELCKKLNIFLKDVWPDPPGEVPPAPPPTPNGTLRKLEIWGYVMFPAICLILLIWFVKQYGTLFWIAALAVVGLWMRLTPIVFSPAKSTEEVSLFDWLKSGVSKLFSLLFRRIFRWLRK